MEIVPLLRKHLKDDAIIEVLEDIDAQVIYDFDRSHENMPDVYWAEAKDRGITMRFDAEQRLDTVFIYVQPIEEHQPADPSLFQDFKFFRSAADVEAYAAEHGIRSRTGLRPTILGQPGNWITLDYADHRVHYDFRDAKLYVITITCAKTQQAI